MSTFNPWGPNGRFGPRKPKLGERIMEVVGVIVGIVFLVCLVLGIGITVYALAGSHG